MHEARFEERTRNRAEAALARLFVPVRDLRSLGERAVLGFWLLALLLGGAAVWAVVLNTGQIPFDIQDWPQEWQYYTILQQALRDGVLPLHITPAVQIEARFLAIPQVVLSPQVVLLRFLSQGQFVLFNVILMYAVGLAGCYAIARRFGLSLFTFTVLGLLFGLNGHIVTHLSVGHSMWLGYYLLPLLLLVLLRVLDDDPPRHWPVWVGLILFGMVLQGSVYLFVWVSLFLALLWIILPGKRRSIALSIGVGVGLSALRIGPSMLLYSQSTHNFFPGYLSLSDLVAALVADSTPYTTGIARAIGWWEYDVYLSLLGTLYVFAFGILPFLRREAPERNPIHRYRMLLGPAAVLAILSIGYFYQPIQSLPLPFISLVRVPSRFLVLPVVLLLVLASISAQAEWNRRPPRLAAAAALLGGLLVIAHDLAHHALTWRIWEVAFAMPEQRRDLVESIRIANAADPTYFTVLAVSVGISLIFLAVSLFVLGGGRTPAAPSKQGGRPSDP